MTAPISISALRIKEGPPLLRLCKLYEYWESALSSKFAFATCFYFHVEALFSLLSESWVHQCTSSCPGITCNLWRIFWFSAMKISCAFFCVAERLVGLLARDRVIFDEQQYRCTTPASFWRSCAVVLFPVPLISSSDWCKKNAPLRGGK